MGAATVWAAPVIQSFTHVAAAGSDDPTTGGATTPPCVTKSYAVKIVEHAENVRAGKPREIKVEDLAGAAGDCLSGVGATSGGDTKIHTMLTPEVGAWEITLVSGAVITAASAKNKGPGTCSGATLSSDKRTATFSDLGGEMRAELLFTICE